MCTVWCIMPIIAFVALKWSCKDLLNESMKLYLAPVSYALTHPFRSCQWRRSTAYISHNLTPATMHVIGIYPELSPTKSWTLHAFRYSLGNISCDPF